MRRIPYNLCGIFCPYFAASCSNHITKRSKVITASPFIVIDRNGFSSLEAFASISTSRLRRCLLFLRGILHGPLASVEKVEINGGKIVSIVKGHCKQGNQMHQQVIDYGDAVVMPGLIDV